MTALQAAKMHAGDEVSVEVLGDGELRVRRGAPMLEEAFGALTGVYRAGYLAQLDADDDAR